MCFPKLITAQAFMENGKPKGDPTYSSECILKPDFQTKFLEDQNGSLTEVDLRVILVQVAKAEWPDINVKEAVASGELFWPIIDGDAHAEKGRLKAVEKKKEPNVDHYKANKVFRVSANQDYAPVLSLKDGGKIVTLNRASDVDMAKAKQAFKGGNYAIAEISAAATKTAQGKFLKFYVNSVRMIRSGDALGGGSGLMSRFDGVNGGKSDHNPMAGLDDEIPF